MSEDGSSPSPTFMASAAATNLSRNASLMDVCNKMRLAQMHVCPALRNFATSAPATAASMSASSNTMRGAFPPSSSDMRFTLSALCCMSSFPTRVDPVKEILRTSGWLVSVWATGAGSFEVMTWKTPAGKPASSARHSSASADKGVSSDGFRMITHPAASAGAALRVIMPLGKFHGVMAPTIPTGCLMTSCRREDALVGITSP